MKPFSPKTDAVGAALPARPFLKLKDFAAIPPETTNRSILVGALGATTKTAKSFPGAVEALLQPLLTRTQAACYLGISPQTLAADVCTKRLGVPMVKIGRRVMYRLADLEAFSAANVRGIAYTRELQ